MPRKMKDGPRRNSRPYKTAKARTQYRLKKIVRGLHNNAPIARVHHPPTATAVKAFRDYLRMPQIMFAKQLGVKVLAVSQWETGRRAPDKLNSQRLRELAGMNGVDIDQMADREYAKMQFEIKVFREEGKSA